MDIDFPCVCGHEALDHPKIGKYGYIMCEECFRENINSWRIRELSCKEYKPDNLRYLEMKAEENKHANINA
jgi:hypothetical protein